MKMYRLTALVLALVCFCLPVMAAETENEIMLASEKDALDYMITLLKSDEMGWGDRIDEMVIECVKTTETQYYVFSTDSADENAYIFSAIILNNGELIYLHDYSQEFEEVAIYNYLEKDETLLSEEKANEICKKYAAYFAVISPERMAAPETYEYRGLWVDPDTSKVYANFQANLNGEWDLDQSIIVEIDQENLRVVDFNLSASNG